MRFVRILIWVATAAFIVMLFAPLVQEMFVRLRILSGGGGPP